MVNLMALVLVAWSCGHTPTRIDTTQADRQMQRTYPSAPRLSAKQKIWFEQAIDHILQGD